MRQVHISRLAVVAAALLGATLLATPAAARLPDRDAPTTLPGPTTATVTVDQLGAGSVLAVVTHGRFEKIGATGLERSLEVITPDGERHPVYSVKPEESPRDWFPGDFVLSDWRPELHTALLRVSRGPDGDTLVSYDVVTGELREVPAPRAASTVALRPDGTGVLFTTYQASRYRGRVGVLGWDGSRAWLPAKGDGSAITSTNGTTLVTSDRQRWWISDLTTRTSTAVATPGYCTPRRWADADAIVATCSRGMGSQLRLVRLDGTSSPLGIRHTERTRRLGAAIFNDDDVRDVRGASWYESYGGCGGGVLTRQTPAGAARIIRVPGRAGALTLVGTRGDHLLLALQRTECGSWPDQAVLSTFDPVSRTETVLTTLGRRESWREVLLASEVRSWLG